MMNLDVQLMQLALHGAQWVLWLLVIGSVGSVAVMAERWATFFVVARREARAVSALERHAARGLSAVLATRGPSAAIVAKLVEAGPAQLETSVVLKSAMGVESQRLRRNLAFLGIVGANAPFVGLLGTVLEILRVFNVLGVQGITNTQQATGVMTGISEALVATGVGLVVAIPASIAYNAFLRRVEGLLTAARDTATRALALDAVSSSSSEETH